VSRATGQPVPLLHLWQQALRQVNKGGRNFTPAEIAVLYAASTYADTRTGGGIYPGNTLLRAGLGMDKKTVSNALGKAERLNVLRLLSRGFSAGNASEYTLVNPCDWSLPSPGGENGPVVKTDQNRGKKRTRTGGENGSPTIHGTIHGTGETTVTASQEAAPCSSEFERESVSPTKGYGRKKQTAVLPYRRTSAEVP
jgi:hypothetical protein